MSIVYILYIVSLPYARDMHGKEFFLLDIEPATWRIKVLIHQGYKLMFDN